MDGFSPRIGIFGTFDLENYGDLLFPLIAERELGRRLGGVCLERFSYRPQASESWPYEVRSVADLTEIAPSLDGVLIGGGHIIRFDKQIAPDYHPTTTEIHHPTGYWLTPALVAHQLGCPVAWNAPGAYGVVPGWADLLMHLAFGLSRYVAVRDEAARVAVAPFAHEVAVVPDTVFGVSALIPRLPSAGFSRLQNSLGLTYPYLVVQATTGLDSFARLLERHGPMLRNYQIVEVPIGPVLGDGVIPGPPLPGAIRLHDWPHPLVLAELISRSDGVVGISMHLAITALSCGVPVFRPADRFGCKYAVLAPFDTVHVLKNEPTDSHWFVERLGRTEPSLAVRVATERLKSHWDRIAEVFRGGRTGKSFAALTRFWQTCPNHLEQSTAV
jgi:lipopolysaccharide transport system ATP-binding protein